LAFVNEGVAPANPKRPNSVFRLGRQNIAIGSPRLLIGFPGDVHSVQWATIRRSSVPKPEKDEREQTRGFARHVSQLAKVLCRVGRGKFEHAPGVQPARPFRLGGDFRQVIRKIVATAVIPRCPLVGQSGTVKIVIDAIKQGPAQAQRERAGQSSAVDLLLGGAGAFVRSELRIGSLHTV